MHPTAATAAARGKNGLVHAEDDGWTFLSFSGRGSILFGAAALNPYQARQTFQVSPGQMLQVEADSYRQSSGVTSSSIFVTLDNKNAYAIVDQVDGNIVIYKYVNLTSTALNASTIAATNNFAGVHSVRFSIVPISNASTVMFGQSGFFRVPSTNGTVSDASLSVVGSVTIYVDATDITRSRARARVVG